MRRRTKGRRARDLRRSGSLTTAGDQHARRLAVLQEIGRWVLTSVVAIAAAVLLMYLFGFRVRVPDGGMEPLLSEGEDVLVFRTAYRLRSPENQDIVAYYPGGDEELTPRIGRIVAGPRETVRIVNGQVVTGTTADPYSGQQTQGSTGTSETGTTVTLEDNEYYVLGDNANSSDDSRDPYIGPVREEDMIGRVWLGLPGSGQRLHLVR